MEPIELIKARDKAELNQNEAAVRIRISSSTLAQFEAGNRPWETMRRETKRKITAFVKKWGEL